jgi:hypothetical protein
MIKLILSWDILPDRDREYFEFMVGEFTPKMTALGLEPIQAWLTMYGRDCPQIIIEAKTDDLQTMRDILKTPQWESLKNKLLNYVTNYTQKVIRGRSHLQL